MSEDDIEFVNVYPEEVALKLRQEFKHLNGSTYLDHAGSTLYSLSQMARVHSNLVSKISLNPHTAGSQRLDRARRLVLDFLSAEPDEYVVVFNSGATSGLKTVGEYFPWESQSESTFNNQSQLFIHKQSHTSSVGIREYARQHGAKTRVWGDQELDLILKSLKEDKQARCADEPGHKNLFCFPAMSNYDGSKADLSWVSRIQENEENIVLLDTASFLATNTIDLRCHKPDFLVLSFYKIFGYPTGLGALVMKAGSGELLRKTYFGGGTVDMHTVTDPIHKPRKSLDEYFEDGTSNFLGIQAIEAGFQAIKSTIGSFSLVSEHTFNLAQYTYNRLKLLEHFNGNAAVQIYSKTQYEDIGRQGGIVNFNLLNSEGNHIGYSTFSRVAETENIIVRTGCFCNTGSCQLHLKLEDDILYKNYMNGHICGDNNDLVDGRPTGSIRVSFGYMSTREDVDRLIQVIQQFFVEKSDTQADKQTLGVSIDQQIKVVDLYLYPVKSCRGIKVSSWEFNRQGLLYDRQWVVMEGSKVLTQKGDTMMAQVETNINLTKGVLVLSFPDLQDLEINLALEAAGGASSTLQQEICVGAICGERLEGLDCGAAAAEWLEDALGRPGLRLVRGLKRFSGRSNPSSSLANDSEILTLNINSIYSLQSRIQQTCQKLQEDCPDLDLGTLTQRFRGNLVITGELPFREEMWTNFQLKKDTAGGDREDNGEESGKPVSELLVVGPCKRCTMIGIEQSSGEQTKEPLRSLATYRDRNFCFGVHTKVLECGTGVISVGDIIQNIQYSA